MRKITVKDICEIARNRAMMPTPSGSVEWVAIKPGEPIRETRRNERGVELASDHMRDFRGNAIYWDGSESVARVAKRFIKRQRDRIAAQKLRQRKGNAPRLSANCSDDVRDGFSPSRSISHSGAF